MAPMIVGMTQEFSPALGLAMDSISLWVPSMSDVVSSSTGGGAAASQVKVNAMLVVSIKASSIDKSCSVIGRCFW